MTQITLDEMKRDLMHLIHRIEAGETLLLIKEGKPVAELKPISHLRKKSRPYGLCAGEFTVPEDFNAPLPQDIIDGFAGK